MPERSGRLHILVEEQTEETIVRRVIEPHLTTLGWWVTLSIVRTKRPATGPAYRGGVAKWSKLEREIRLLLGDTSLTVLTTLLDYYAFPVDAPGMSGRPASGPVDRVAHVETAISTHFADRRLVPHLVLHEVEAWVFAAHRPLGELHGDALADRLKADVDAAGGPELVNDGVNTAPSKRLRKYCPGYVKTMDGPLAVEELGLAELRAQCPHLDEWLKGLE